MILVCLSSSAFDVDHSSLNNGLETEVPWHIVLWLLTFFLLIARLAIAIARHSVQGIF